MPKVGSKEFPYTREGIAAAKAEALTTGLPIKARKTYAETAHAQKKRAKSGASYAQQKAGAGAIAAGHGAQTAPLDGAVGADPKPSLAQQFKGDASGQPKPVNKANK